MLMPMPDYYQRNEALIASLKDIKMDILSDRINRGYSIIREIHMITDADSPKLVDLISKINELYKQNYKK